MSQPTEITLLKTMKENQENSQQTDEPEIQDFSEIRNEFREKNQKALAEIIDYFFDKCGLSKDNKKEDVLNNIDHPISFYSEMTGTVVIGTILSFTVSKAIRLDYDEKKQILVSIKCLLQSGAQLLVSLPVKNSPQETYVHSIFHEVLGSSLLSMPRIHDYAVLETLSDHMVSEKKRLRDIIGQPCRRMSRLSFSVIHLINEYSPFIDFFYQELDSKDPMNIWKHLQAYSGFDMSSFFSFIEKYSNNTLELDSNTALKNSETKSETKEEAESISLSTIPDAFNLYLKFGQLSIDEKHPKNLSPEKRAEIELEMDALLKKTKDQMISQSIHLDNPSPLYLFATHGYTSMVKQLFEQSSCLETRFLKKVTVFNDQVISFNLNVVQTILLESMITEKLDTVAFLLKQRKEDLEIPGVCCWSHYDSSKTGIMMTPLLWAVALQWKNHWRINFPSHYFVRMFLEAGANLTKTTSTIKMEHIHSAYTQGEWNYQNYYEHEYGLKRAKSVIDSNTIQDILDDTDFSDFKPHTALDLCEKNHITANNSEIADLLYLHIYRQIKTKKGAEPEPQDYEPYSCLKRDKEFWNKAISRAQELEQNYTSSSKRLT